MSPWIQTYTGRVIDLLDPDPDQICIRDIAHALANTNRFNGHARSPYSVAQHSIWVSKHASGEHQTQTMVNETYAKYGLLHDATEAYLGDVTSPLKRLLPEYRVIYDRMERTVLGRFGLSSEIPDAVKEADMSALQTERFSLLRESPRPWGTEKYERWYVVYPWKWTVAENEFLKRFHKLFGGIHAS